jgi:hypothetical protein
VRKLTGDAHFLQRILQEHSYKSIENPILLMSEEDIFETDLIADTSCVKRLRVSCIENSELFEIQLTIPCQTIFFHPIETEHELPHEQDTVRYQATGKYIERTVKNLICFYYNHFLEIFVRMSCAIKCISYFNMKTNNEVRYVGALC